ncbi:MAG: hypothetical protein IH946_07440 [Bacteroidetes bacterium]|nr:hypothetical protein [Bacteroidota bacterium]
MKNLIILLILSLGIEGCSDDDSPTQNSFDTNSFEPKVDYSTGTGPFSISIGDLDLDSKADLAVANISSNKVSVFRMHKFY